MLKEMFIFQIFNKTPRGNKEPSQVLTLLLLLFKQIEQTQETVKTLNIVHLAQSIDREIKFRSIIQVAYENNYIQRINRGQYKLTAKGSYYATKAQKEIQEAKQIINANFDKYIK